MIKVIGEISEFKSDRMPRRFTRTTIVIEVPIDDETQDEVSTLVDALKESVEGIDAGGDVAPVIVVVDTGTIVYEDDGIDNE